MDKRKPRVLVLDCETVPATAYVWGLFDQNIGLNQLIEPGRTIMVGAKFVGEPKLYQYDEKSSDKHMWYKIYTLMCQADAVVTFNGNRFDLPKIRGALIQKGYDSLPPLTSIDLLREVKKLGFISNKLAFVAPALKIGKKMETGGFELWSQCLAGDKKAWAKMRAYNAMDVRLTEKLYLKMRPHIHSHPFLGVPKERGDRYECNHCNRVGAEHQHRGHYRTKAFITERIQCLACGGWGQGKKEKVK